MNEQFRNEEENAGDGIGPVVQAEGGAQTKRKVGELEQEENQGDGQAHPIGGTSEEEAQECSNEKHREGGSEDGGAGIALSDGVDEGQEPGQELVGEVAEALGAGGIDHPHEGDQERAENEREGKFPTPKGCSRRSDFGAETIHDHGG